MSRSRKNPRALLDAWRAQDGARFDPVRFHFIDALERRTASHTGEARRLLDQRLSGLLADYASDLKASGSRTANAAAKPCLPASGTLAALVDEISHRADSRGAVQPAIDPVDSTLSQQPLPELAALGEFRKIWTSVRAEGQLRQSLEEMPENAGPLNSRSLVHRALALMREESAGYLQHFLSYVDAVSWAEQLHAGRTVPGKAAPRAAPGGKRTRRKPRTGS